MYAIRSYYVRRQGAAGDGPVTLHRAVGCEACGGSGYSGRSAIIELLEISEAMRSLILQGSDKSALAACAQKEGARTMYQDGLRKVMRGVTTLVV